MSEIKCRTMSMIPLSLWLPLSVGACVLLVLAAVGWLWRRALRIPLDSRDGRASRSMATVATAGLLLWLGYGLLKGYGALWRADALLLMAQSSLLTQIPLIVGGLAWVAALLLGRVMALHKPLE
jgi:asparagine N-glycosylation enzyme membrane subunit Stt3